MSGIKVAVVGVGNCVSSLVQGIYFYKDKNVDDSIGLTHYEISGYRPSDIEIVAAFDIDQRKIGQDLSKAIFAPPNCTKVFHDDIPHIGTTVSKSPIMDGYSAHQDDFDDKYTFLPYEDDAPTKEDILKILRDSQAQILVNYLPVGSQEAACFYAECALEVGMAFVNNIPVFIASDKAWADRFAEKGLPIIGDDIKSQLGATITHRVLTDIFKKRGIKLESTYQLNTGGNTDFLNMLNRKRLASKKISKTEAVQSVTATRLCDENIHVGPSDYVPWQKDNKVCFIRMNGRMFGNVPMDLELRLSVEDSPNSAGVAIDTIRCAKLALDRNIAGVLHAPSAYFCKHPPVQYTDDEALQMVEAFIHSDKL